MESSEDSERIDVGGLLGGLTAYHIRILCDNPWDGGAGYTIEQVGQMTLDQIWARLCDRDVLKRAVGQRHSLVTSLEALTVVKPDNSGLIKGVSRDGKPMKARIAGKSKARQLMEEREKRKAQERAERKKRRRR